MLFLLGYDYLLDLIKHGDVAEVGGGEKFREEEEGPGARADAAAFFAANPAVTLSGEPVGR